MTDKHEDLELTAINCIKIMYIKQIKIKNEFSI